MLREEPIIFNRGLIASGNICLRNYVGKGSCTQLIILMR